LADYAKEKNKILAVNMERRLSPCVVALGEALRGKIIGDLLSIDVEMGDPYIWMSETGSFFSKENGGFLVDFGIHYLDLIWYLVGRLIPVSYRDDYQGGVEANFEFQLRTEEGIPLRIGTIADA
jgi:predicted dehydrogenase